jgi:hypothetical protein
VEKTEENRNIFSKGMSSIPKLYLLYAAGVAALSYGIAKKYMDDLDPNRARLKAIKEYAKERAKMTGVPQLMEDPSDPTYERLKGTVS